jgi:hypothetical protein
MRLSLLTLALLSACAQNPTSRGPTSRDFGPELPSAVNKPAPSILVPLQSEPLQVVPAQISAAKQAQTVQAIRVDPPRPGGHSSEPSISGFSDGQRDHLILGWHHVTPGTARDDLGIGAAVSRDNGQTWTTRIYSNVANAGDVKFDPNTAADAQSKTLWLGALARPLNATQNFATMFLTVPNNAAGLGDIRILDSLTEDKPLMSFGRRGAQGELVIAASRNFRYSNDLGQSFSTQAIPTSEGNATGYAPIYFSDGEMVAIAQSFSLGLTVNSSSIVLRRKAANANTFGPMETVRGLNYNDLQSIDSAVPGRFRIAPMGQLARDSNDTLYYVYHDIRDTQGLERNLEVLLIRSTDRGRTWSMPVVVNGEATSPRDQFSPTLSIGPDNALSLIYFDTRRSSQLDSSQTAFLDVVYARSTDGGLSFTEHF